LFAVFVEFEGDAKDAVELELVGSKSTATLGLGKIEAFDLVPDVDEVSMYNFGGEKEPSDVVFKSNVATLFTTVELMAEVTQVTVLVAVLRYAVELASELGSTSLVTRVDKLSRGDMALRPILCTHIHTALLYEL